MTGLHGEPARGQERPDVAGVVAPPPLILAAGLGAGVLADVALPWLRPPAPLRRLLGAPLLAAGVLLAAWAVFTMRRAGTPLNPAQPSTALVTDGPFRLSRNPGYLSLTLAYLGLSFLLGRGWPLALLPGVLAVVQRGVVAREERYLERRFGDAYRRYRQRVPRWL